MKHCENIRWQYSLFAFILLFFACGPSQKVVEVEEVDYIQLDTLTVVADRKEAKKLPEYRTTATRTWDLIKTTLDIELLWQSKSVKGNAILTLSPLFYPSDEIVLDAQDMEIGRVRANNKNLDFSYNDTLLVVRLPRVYHRGETLQLFIGYEAFPYRAENVVYGGRGMYFIGEGEDFGQAWTQGETEYNSRWFPSIDKPNERCLQEMRITVPQGVQCLSNGVLQETKKMEDKTTYHYQLDQSHAPYLFMIAAGYFHIEEDQWEDIPLAYWVDTAYADHAKRIFNHTPEMLSFFSRIFDYRYPWPKYDQAVVKEYVSGAMENTTAVLFGEFVQRVTGELIDDNNDYIVAHEMAHHWFGDLATCESWSNLTMNEGFANYSEYLWTEYKYGYEEAEWMRLNERQGYMTEFYSGRQRPLIDFRYEDKEDMFDAHSYNKGGLILHMLRKELGDEAFFAGLQYFLDEHAYSSVEAHDLRLAMEKVTGLDLNTFFNQWYFQKGHPILDITYSYRDSILDLSIKQVQEESFEFPIDFKIYLPDEEITISRYINAQVSSFEIPLDQGPTLVVPDPERELLAECKIPYTAAQAREILTRRAPLHWRHKAMNVLEFDTTAALDSWVPVALEDTHASVRSYAMEMVLSDPSLVDGDQLMTILSRDKDGEMRAMAAELLSSGYYEVDAQEALKTQIQKDSSHQVLAACLRALALSDPVGAQQLAGQFKNSQGSQLRIAAATVMAIDPKPEDLRFIEDLFDNLDEGSRPDFAAPVSDFIIGLTAKGQKPIAFVDKIEKDAKESNSMWSRYASTLTVFFLGLKSTGEDREDYAQKLQEIKDGEKSDYLRDLFQSFTIQ